MKIKKHIEGEAIHCPSCGQAVPADDVGQALRQMAVARRWKGYAKYFRKPGEGFSLAVAVLLLASGCGKGDPASSRLAVGSEAIVVAPERVDDPDNQEVIDLTDGKAAKVPKAYMKYLSDPTTSLGLLPGLRVRISADDKPEEVRKGQPADADGVVDRRPVQVYLLDGDHEKRAGYLQRNMLRPAP